MNEVIVKPVTSSSLTIRILYVLLLLHVVLGLSEFLAPISGDTAIYAYAGRAIGQGQVIYRDVWDFKTPGIYYLFAAIFRVLPDSLLTLRLVALVWGVTAGLTFWWLASRLYAPQTALILTGFFLLWTNLGGKVGADGPFPETFLPLIVLLVYILWFRYRSSGRLGWLMIAGFAAGCGVLLKQTAAITVVGVMATLALDLLLYRRFAGRILWAPVVLAFGVCLAIGPWFAYFASQSALVSFWQAVVEYPALYAATTPLRQAGHNALTLFLGMVPFLGLLYVMVPLAVWRLWTRAREADLKSIVASPFFALALWAVLETLSISATGRFYERYLLQPLPAFLLIAGKGVEPMVHAWSSPGSPHRAALIIGLSVATLVALVSQLPRSVQWLDRRVLSPVPTRSELVADYLAAHSDAEDSIFAWGDHRIPFVANRPTGVKWLNEEPFRTSRHFVTPAVIGEVLAELAARPPRYFVESPSVVQLRDSYLGNTAVERFIREHYRLVTRIGDAELWEHQPGPE